jgi:hypothetical protein
MDGRTITENFKVIPFLFRTMPNPGIPNQRDYDSQAEGRKLHRLDVHAIVSPNFG